MNLNKPKPFTPNKNQIAKDWQIWKEEFFVYLRLSKAYILFSNEQRALMLINFMGSEAFKAIEEIPVNNSDKKDMNILIEKFNEFFNPSLNEAEERYTFFSRRKNFHEDLDTYVLEMKGKAEKCKFGCQSEQFVIDMLILSMNKNLRQLIWTSELKSLPEIISSWKQYDINQSRMEETIRQNSNLKNVENAKSDDKQPHRHFPAHYVCSKCGLNHPYKECPAFNKMCQKCFIKGHYTSKCKQMEPLNKQASTLKNEKNEIKAKPLNEQNNPSTSGVQPNQEGCPQDIVTLPTTSNAGNIVTLPPTSNAENIVTLPSTSNAANIVTLPSTSNAGNFNINQEKFCTKCNYKHNENTACTRKYCGTCHFCDHWDINCPIKNKQLNNHAKYTVSNNDSVNISQVKSYIKYGFKYNEIIGCPPKYYIACQVYPYGGYYWINHCSKKTINTNVVDDSVEIRNSFHQQAQLERFERMNNQRLANSHRYNRNTKFLNNSKAKDDTCCII